MAGQQDKIQVAVNGYGVIGKRVADAVASQDDMALVGVADIEGDWRMRVAERKGFAVFASLEDRAGQMREAGIKVAGHLDDLLGKAEVVVDCTPKRVAAKNVEAYRRRGIKFIVQGGEKHEVTGHSFVADANYAEAVGTGVDAGGVMQHHLGGAHLTMLKQAGLLRRARGTLMRRATDPWESHKGGIMNTLVPEPEIPSHQGPDAQTVDPTLDVITMAVKVPETIAHLHCWAVQLTREASREDVARSLPQLKPHRAHPHGCRFDGAQLGQGAHGRPRPAARQPLRGSAVVGHAEGQKATSFLRLHGR
jgi:glyceraldehyde-3-phosphate dehydrogenase (NAD(P))